MCQRDRSARACFAKSAHWFWSGFQLSTPPTTPEAQLCVAPGNASIKGEIMQCWLWHGHCQHEKHELQVCSWGSSTPCGWLQAAHACAGRRSHQTITIKEPASHEDGLQYIQLCTQQAGAGDD